MNYVIYYFLVEDLAKLPVIKIYVIQKVLYKYSLIYPIQIPASFTLMVSAFGGNSEILFLLSSIFPP